jgi:DNA-binding CsgD family transcriptional regulator
MDLARSIDEVFAAAFDPARWPETLETLSRAAGAAGATLVFGAPPSLPHTTASSTTIAPLVGKYFSDRTVDDPREDRVAPTAGGGFETDFDIFTPAELARDPFYQEFLRPHGLGWHGAARLSDETVKIILSFKRTLRQGPYDSVSINRLDHFLPHLRAIARAAMAVHNGMIESQLDALGRAGFGAMTLDWHGRALGTNDRIRFDDGLELHGGRPVAAHRGDRAALQAAVDHAMRPERPSTLRAPVRVPLRRPSGRRPLLVEVLPLIGQPGMALLNAVALLLVTDLDAARAPHLGELQDVFGLTPREAAFAAWLATGAPLDVAAERLQISREHARQRLKAIFRKTETHRQGELVALLARLSHPPLPAGDG